MYYVFVPFILVNLAEALADEPLPTPCPPPDGYKWMKLTRTINRPASDEPVIETSLVAVDKSQAPQSRSVQAKDSALLRKVLRYLAPEEACASTLR